MINIKKAVISISGFLFFASTAIAGDVWSNGATINNIEMLEVNKIIIYVPVTTPNVGECRDSSYGKIMYAMAGQNTLTQDSVKSVLSIALTAKITGRKVDIYHDHLDTCFIRNIRL